MSCVSPFFHGKLFFFSMNCMAVRVHSRAAGNALSHALYVAEAVRTPVYDILAHPVIATATKEITKTIQILVNGTINRVNVSKYVNNS